MDRVGLLVDNQQKEKLLIKYSTLYNSSLGMLRKIVNNDTFNPRSNPQVGKLIYEDLKYPMRRKTDEETGRVTYQTDKDTLDDLTIHHAENNKVGKLGYEIISRIIVTRKLAKVLEYVDTPLHSDNRFKASSNLAGPKTGRSSSHKTIDERLRFIKEIKDSKYTKRLGRSLQTVTKHGFTVDEDVFDDFESKQIANDIRSIFVPYRNHLFIEGDGSGAEARVVFVLAEDYDGLAAMDQKPKIHAKTAALLFNIDVNLIRKDHLGNWTPAIPKVGLSYYDMGKKVRHAGNYDMGDFRLCQMTHVPIDECGRMLTIFHDSSPQIRMIFHAGIISQLRLTRELVNPFGRRRTFFSQLNEKTFKEAFAEIPQNTISDLTKFTMWRIKEDLDPTWYFTKYRFLSEMHDALLSEVHKDYKNQYMDSFRKNYERPISFRNCSLSRDYDLTIPLELSWSDTNWMSMIEV